MGSLNSIKQIVVSASASRSSGALTIYKQFLNHLPDYIDGMHYTIFVDPFMPQPVIIGVDYITVNTKRQYQRILFDWYLSGKELKKRNIIPDLIISLQNTGLRCLKEYPQLVYFHQPFPFYTYNFKLNNRGELAALMYKYIYPIFVKKSISKDTHFVGQIPFISEGISKLFKVPAEHVHTLFPDVESIETASVTNYDKWDDGCNHFMYPATAYRYKGHLTIVEALLLLKERGVNNIKVHFTLTENEMPLLKQKVRKYGLERSIDFMGPVPHEIILRMYKSSVGLLFPSVIETLGLPLLEASVFGKPIIAADVRYAHEVIGNYEGAKFVNPNDFMKWADEIYNITKKNQHYDCLKTDEKSSWDDFFSIARQLAKIDNNN